MLKQQYWSGWYRKVRIPNMDSNENWDCSGYKGPRLQAGKVDEIDFFLSPSPRPTPEDDIRRQVILTLQYHPVPKDPNSSTALLFHVVPGVVHIHCCVTQHNVTVWCVNVTGLLVVPQCSGDVFPLTALMPSLWLRLLCQVAWSCCSTSLATSQMTWNIVR